MVRDIAELQILGPNPVTMLKAIEAEILRKARITDQQKAIQKQLQKHKHK